MLTLSFLHCLIDQLVVDESVVVVHMTWIYVFVMPLDVLRGYTFAEIRFDRVHTHIEEFLHALAEPIASLRVCKVDDPHASLPKIPLPHISVRLLQQIAFLGSILKHGACLTNVGIRPNTDFVNKSVVLHALDLTCRV